ncbi:protein sprouty homolog 2 [Mastacembelus armatus]|uniref:Protein sprouty homolog 2 n=1 Tax=Mastacembelus armatus TaxID=205130 RepID=A0A3Q3L9V6_9TELE|nr:protein sprouty homolog 2 [Mastacembelus armatus]XP_026158013.1 protein sprouty homolog 2 [Mastacembelus armatus]
MDSARQNDIDGGGGRRGWSPSSTGSPGTARDEGRLQLQTHDGLPDPGFNDGQPTHTPAVLSLDQIRVTGSSNEYTEGPLEPLASWPTRQQGDSITPPGSRASSRQETREERPTDLRDPRSSTRRGNANTSISSMEGMQRTSSIENCHSSITTSVGSASSAQRLLGSPAGGGQIIGTQPKRAEIRPEELKPLNEESRGVAVVPGTGGSDNPIKHSNKCENCGRCRCSECGRPRVLPSCWLCGRRCICSLESAVEYMTCVCCVKGLFYHCSSDDEDMCTDKPFSCTQSHCCLRWTTVSLLSLLFPCLLCYLPGKGCLSVCQSCYDRVTRPGCRCDPVHSDGAAKPT